MIFFTFSCFRSYTLRAVKKIIFPHSVSFFSKIKAEGGEYERREVSMAKTGKNSRWLVAIFICLLCGPLYAQGGDSASRGVAGALSGMERSGDGVSNDIAGTSSCVERGGDSASRGFVGVSNGVGRSGLGVANQQQTAAGTTQGQAGSIPRESASGLGVTQTDVMPSYPRRAEDLTPSMIKSLVDGVFYITSSEIGDPNPILNNLEEGILHEGWNDTNNPVFTRRGKLIKKDDFFGSGFEISMKDQTLIPVDLKPRFQIDGLEVLVCYQPIAYIGDGTGPVMVSVLGIKAITPGSNP